MSTEPADLRPRDPQEIEAEVVAKFGHLFRDGETIDQVTPTDLRHEGEFETGYVVLTDQRLLLGYEADEEWYQSVALDALTDIKLEQFVGNAVIRLETGDDVTEFVRFSLTRLRDFYDLIELIEDMLVAEGRTELDEEDLHAREARQALRSQDGGARCEKCGHVLRRGVCPVCLEKTKLLRRVFNYVLPYWKLAGLAVLVLLLNSTLALAPPHLTGLLVDTALPGQDQAGGGDISQLWYLTSLLAGVFLIKAVLSGAQSYLNTWIGQRIVRDLRSEVFHHLQYLKMHFFNHVRTGSIMSRTTSDTQQLQRFITRSTQDLIQQVFMVIGIAAVLFIGYDWRLALVTLGPMPFIIIAIRMFIRRIRKIYRRIWIRRALMNSVLADSIPGIKVVKSFAQEQREIDKFDHRSDQVFDNFVDAARYRSVFMPFLNLATSFGVIAIWAYGGWLVIEVGDLTTGQLVAFLYYINQFYNPLRQLSGFADVIQEAATAAERVFEILDTEPEVAPSVKKKRVDIEGRLEFRDVHFAYESNEPVLEGVNVSIEPGEMIGLVGPSGAGKTTFVNLVPRLYDATAGAVLVDGHNVNDLDLKHYRDQIGVVLQDPLLFHGSVAENIAYGKPDASLEEVIWAAQAANAHDFIMDFPDGYDTHTGERGLRLSGGQKQRISIARAILKNPRILILDEATSSVDTETEKLIQQAIDNLVSDRTTLAIAHRLSTLQNADRLLVLEAGRVVEEGTHAELMELDGVFARLSRMQAEIAETRAV